MAAISTQAWARCLLAALFTSIACSSSDHHASKDGNSSEDGGPEGTGGGSTPKGHGSGGASSHGSGGTSSSGASTGESDAATSGGGRDAGKAGGTGGSTSPLIHVSGTPDTSVKTALPALPQLTNVVATATHDNVEIGFDPVDGARDYRVYVLPSDSDVSHDDSGHVTVKNAIYRCAGDRQMPAATMDGTPQVPGGGIKTLVDGQDIIGYTRKLDEATLGYVYYGPGDGRVPVYAMGNPAGNGDNSCYFQRWGASRAKRYVVDEAERAQLLKAKWRDDGIVFYVPSAASSSTRTVYAASTDIAQFYFIDGPEAAVRKNKAAAFQVLTAAADDTKPLMRVFYANLCGINHDELVAGKARFDWVRQQGDQIPVNDLHWAGLTKETTLVIEALQDGCPYQGFLAPISLPANVSPDKITYPPWYTVSDLQKASPSGEAYINGQHDANTNPRPIARSFVKISPGPKPDLDWFMGFQSEDELGTLGPPPGGGCGESGPCFQEWEQVSKNVDISYILMESDRHAAHTFLGELWVTYADSAADRNGKFRLTPIQKATMSPDSYLHVTMTTDDFTTGRRYPQFLISDVDAPVQQHMTMGNTLVVQTFADFPNVYQVEVCDHKFWDVNQQCPSFDMYHVYDPKDSTKVIGLAPNDEVGEHVGMDRSMRMDAYVSTKRIYTFLDDQPYGCADLPTAGVPSGAVTVTFGNVLYHSGVDKTFTYTKQYMQTETRNHFDNLGFKSGVDAPSWDENRFPCVSQLK